MADKTYEKDPLEKGSFWIKTSANGDYLSGNVDGKPYVAFRNKYKKPGDKSPDWRVMSPKPRDPKPDDDAPF